MPPDRQVRSELANNRSQNSDLAQISEGCPVTVKFALLSMKSARSLVLSLWLARSGSRYDGRGQVSGVAVAAGAAGERFTVEFQVADGSGQREPFSPDSG